MNGCPLRKGTDTAQLKELGEGNNEEDIEEAIKTQATRPIIQSRFITRKKNRNIFQNPIKRKKSVFMLSKLDLEDLNVEINN